MLEDLDVVGCLTHIMMVDCMPGRDGHDTFMFGV